MINKRGLLIVILLSIYCYGCTNLKENKTGQYFLLRGINLSQQEKFEEALTCYNKSYEINPRNIILLKELGYIYYNFGQYSKAEKYWNEGLKISKTDEEIKKNLITMYYKNGDFEKAKETINISLNPNNEYIKKIKGLILYDEGEFKNAYDVLKTINKSNFDELTYIKYLQLVKKNKNLENYYEILKEGQELFGNNRKYILTCAKELSKEFKKYEEAENILLRYLLNNGNDKEVVLMLSWVYTQTGNKQKAEESLLLLPKI